MPTSPTLVPAGPTVPSSADAEATFDAAYEAFNTWEKDTLQPGMNALATNVYNNAVEAAAGATASAAAVAAANFKGNWSSLTGALAIPASVAHSGKTWQLLASVPDVTAHTPGVSGNWLLMPMASALGAPIASAATVNLDTATGDLVHITGTTTITAITLASGSERTVVFDGALTLTHNATTLILPGGANIVTAAGDRATLRGDGAGNVRCIHYTKASGAAVISSGGMEFLGTITASNSATIDLEQFSATYDNYLIIANDITPSISASYLTLNLKYGGSYYSGTNWRHMHRWFLYSTYSSQSMSQNTSTTSLMRLIASSAITTTEKVSFIVQVAAANNSNSIKVVSYKAQSYVSSELTMSEGEGFLLSSISAIQGVRIAFNAGNVATGSFSIYGMKKA